LKYFNTTEITFSSFVRFSSSDYFLFSKLKSNLRKKIYQWWRSEDFHSIKSF